MESNESDNLERNSFANCDDYGKSHCHFDSWRAWLLFSLSFWIVASNIKLVHAFISLLRKKWYNLDFEILIIGMLNIAFGACTLVASRNFLWNRWPANRLEIEIRGSVEVFYRTAYPFCLSFMVTELYLAIKCPIWHKISITKGRVVRSNIALMILSVLFLMFILLTGLKDNIEYGPISFIVGLNASYNLNIYPFLLYVIQNISANVYVIILICLIFHEVRRRRPIQISQISSNRQLRNEAIGVNEKKSIKITLFLFARYGIVYYGTIATYYLLTLFNDRMIAQTVFYIVYFNGMGDSAFFGLLNKRHRVAAAEMVMFNLRTFCRIRVNILEGNSFYSKIIRLLFQL